MPTAVESLALHDYLSWIDNSMLPLPFFIFFCNKIKSIKLISLVLHITKKIYHFISSILGLIKSDINKLYYNYIIDLYVCKNILDKFTITLQYGFKLIFKLIYLLFITKIFFVFFNFINFSSLNLINTFIDIIV